MPERMAGLYAATLTMRPSRRGSMRRSAAREQRNVERQFASIIFSKSATEVAATRPGTNPPAVCTAPHRAPRRFSAAP